MKNFILILSLIIAEYQQEFLPEVHCHHCRLLPLLREEKTLLARRS
jgi:hypothetical protein